MTFKVSGTSKKAKAYIKAKTEKQWFEAEQVLVRMEQRKKVFPSVPLLVSKEGEIFLPIYDANIKKIVRYTVTGVRQVGKCIEFTTKKTIE